MYLVSLSVQVFDLATRRCKYSIDKPRTRYLDFSPGGTYLSTWEPYASESPEIVAVV